MPDLVTVRVSMFADPIQVPPDEVEALRSQGLLVPDLEPAPAAVEPPPTATSTKKDAS
ncbi:hypothetical protein [Kitasatospora kifunensis]|uniref:Uncharacterized protein n=1 Tax=Kitasatospora kifunensis TaxID=58351 RepID=A0A7W7VUA3_KITKI|nr:hypothetical protein [Kitasatospora kifunensis]MBB4922275.1 hypothetical protein [Kitasatospora kifunensis]